MTLSAVDTPNSLIGANRADTDKDDKNSSAAGNTGLFATLLHSTGVQQVAYAGSTQTFDETLDMQNETISREAKRGDDQSRYETLGLVSADAAVIETTRAPKQLKDLTPENAGKRAQEGANPDANKQNGEELANTGELLSGDPAELAALGIPAQQSAVDLTRTANLTDARQAADKQATAPKTPIQLNLADQAAKSGKENVTAEELPKSRYASAVPEKVVNQNGKANGGINISKVQEEAVSVPASSLAASATLAAQTNRAAKPTLEAPIDLADDLGTEGRPLLDANTGRTNARPQANAPQTPQVPQNANTGRPEAVPANAGLPPVQNVVTPQTSATAAAQAATARADIPIQSTQPTVSDPLGAGPNSSNSNQSSQRAQQQEAPQAPRRAIPPQEVTGQVAVQIKKAIGQGADHIKIQLKPAELGRVEVKLEVTEDGRAMAIVSAERPETLDLLQRDASGLRQALQDAGLSTDSNSLSFNNLRNEAGKFEQQLAEHGQPRKSDGEDTANADQNDDAQAAEAALIAAQNAAADGRVNIKI